MKSWLKRVLRFAPVRALFQLVALAYEMVSRLANACAAALHFPDAPDAVCHWTATVKYANRVRLGKRVVIGPNCIIGAHGGIELGDDVHLSEGVVIETGGLDFSGEPPFPHVANPRPIRIGAGTWLGTKAVVLAGVTIGEGAIIGAMTVVARDVAPFAIVVGPRGMPLPGRSRRWPDTGPAAKVNTS